MAYKYINYLVKHPTEDRLRWHEFGRRRELTKTVDGSDVHPTTKPL